MAMHDPCHPGEIIKYEIIEPLGLTLTSAAKALGVSRVALSRLINEQASLSPEMAIRLQKAFGPSYEHLMRMQAAWDIAQARHLMDEIDVEAYEASG